MLDQPSCCSAGVEHWLVSATRLRPNGWIEMSEMRLRLVACRRWWPAAARQREAVLAGHVADEHHDALHPSMALLAWGSDPPAVHLTWEHSCITLTAGRRLACRFSIGLDFAGGLGGAAGQVAHPSATTATRVPASPAGRLDGGVEGQQVGLLGDAADDVEDVANLAARMALVANHRRSAAKSARVSWWVVVMLPCHHLAPHLGGLLHILHPLQGSGLAAWATSRTGPPSGSWRRRPGGLPDAVSPVIRPHRFGVAVVVSGAVELGRRLGGLLELPSPSGGSAG